MVSRMLEKFRSTSTSTDDVISFVRRTLQASSNSATMDKELLIALAILWFSSTLLLILLSRFIFVNDSEAFHPHSVEVELRHASSQYLCVGATECKRDCAVKHISSFVAPRGSSSSKYFDFCNIAMAVAGVLGTARWHAVGDASSVEATLAYIGFVCLAAVSFFEWDQSPERFLEDKIMITGWMLEKCQRTLPFTWSIRSPETIEFLRQSPLIYNLYEEDMHINQTRHASYVSWRYSQIWVALHGLGSFGYLVCIVSSILLNDMNEEKVAWIACSLFAVFMCLAGLTGNWVPLPSPLRGLVLVWNPFVREPHFMIKLEQSVDAYMALRASSSSSASSSKLRTPRRRRTISDTVPTAPPITAAEADAVDARTLNNFALRAARRHPQRYLQTIGHILVWIELIAMLTPVVAMGMQWMTALCDGAPVQSVLDLLSDSWTCLKGGDCLHNNSCILRHR